MKILSLSQILHQNYPTDAFFFTFCSSLTLMFSVSKQKDMSQNQMTTPLDSLDSSSIVSCPGFSIWDFKKRPVLLFFTMATCYHNGNECVLHSITHTSSTSTETLAKKRIKHGLLLNSDLMSCEMTER